MRAIKTIAVLITFFLAGYLIAQYDTNRNVIQSTKSGDFIIRNGHIYTVQELTHDNFYTDLKNEINNKKGVIK
jgi:riboflavin synthase alpha subunit